MSVQRRIKRNAARRKPVMKTPVQAAIDQAESELDLYSFDDKASYCEALGKRASQIHGSAMLTIDPESAHVPHFDGPHPEWCNTYNLETVQ